jgi:hypothetical protein
MVSVKPTLPVAPAVYVTVCVVEPAVIVPFVAVHEYDAAPAGPLAVLPVDVEQTPDEDGVMVGTGVVQRVSKQRLTSVRCGETVLSVDVRNAVYFR